VGDAGGGAFDGLCGDDHGVLFQMHIEMLRGNLYSSLGTMMADCMKSSVSLPR
jgi:hypothetical protein